MSVHCPFCEGQGEIYRAIVAKDGAIIYICGECDAVWQTDQITDANAEPFDCYMLKKGLPPLWSEFSTIEKL